MKLFASLAGSILLTVTVAAPAFAQEQTPPPAQTPLPPSTSGAGGRAPMTPEMAAARRAMRSACATDMASFCAKAQPAQPAQAGQRGGGARLQCLRGHALQLSMPCRQALIGMRDARKAAKS